MATPVKNMYHTVMPLPSLSRWRNWEVSCKTGQDNLGRIRRAGCSFNPALSGILQAPGYWGLSYVVHGRGLYRDAHHNIAPVAEGDWILTFPEVAFALEPDTLEPWHEIYVHFEGSVFETWRRAGHLDPSQPVGSWLPPREGMGKFKPFFQTLEDPASTTLQTVCSWQALMADIVTASNRSRGKYPLWLRKALSILEGTSSLTEPDVRKLAEQCGMGYESFRVKFRRVMGEPPARWSLGRRIERARRLITTRSITNKQLATKLGFSDEFHFSKTFKRFTGQSPRAFKKRSKSS